MHTYVLVHYIMNSWLDCMTNFILLFYGTVSSTNVPEKLEGEDSNNSGMCVCVCVCMCVCVCVEGSDY